MGIVPGAVTPVTEAPPPPTGLLALTRDAWADFWSSPLAGLVETRTDLMALRRLFQFYDEHERALRSFRRQRTVKGSTGQERANPLLRAVATPHEILALEDRFGLSPRSRLELGVILGDAARSLADLADVPDDAGAADDWADPRLTVVDGTAG